MKHVAIYFHFIRDHVQTGSLRVAHVSTDDQLADALTKSLPHSKILVSQSQDWLLIPWPILRGHIR
ncbi:hypothetical protein Patl1_16496 [Pistacia atlantica]|uniref:Uncharacterized protein n=1 Tax=Pistacia atlantica TaxID=434234 RepID=A0ACC1B5A0_9ROSI|nr:hypothetical protein Patl1_16496 [Pistacia atlantica]